MNGSREVSRPTSKTTKNMVRIIKSLHSGMLASVRVRGGVSVSFVISNGLRQGCSLAPFFSQCI